MKYYIWMLDAKTKVPSKDLETTCKWEFTQKVSYLIKHDLQFSLRVEKL